MTFQHNKSYSITVRRDEGPSSISGKTMRGKYDEFRDLFVVQTEGRNTLDIPTEWVSFTYVEENHGRN
jgi:hypothetical protein